MARSCSAAQGAQGVTLEALAAAGHNAASLGGAFPLDLRGGRDVPRGVVVVSAGDGGAPAQDRRHAGRRAFCGAGGVVSGAYGRRPGMMRRSPYRCTSAIAAVARHFARRLLGVAGQHRLYDRAMLRVDVAPGRLDRDRHAPVALALLVQRIAEAHQPLRPSGLEHFPAKWTPVRRRKCDRGIARRLGSGRVCQVSMAAAISAHAGAAIPRAQRIRISRVIALGGVPELQPCFARAPISPPFPSPSSPSRRSSARQRPIRGKDADPAVVAEADTEVEDKAGDDPRRPRRRHRWPARLRRRMWQRHARQRRSRTCT